MEMMKEKLQRSFRCSEKFHSTLAVLSEDLGISYTATLEVLLRRFMRLSEDERRGALEDRKAINRMERERESSSPMAPAPYRLTPAAVATIQGLSDLYPDLSQSEILELVILYFELHLSD